LLRMLHSGELALIVSMWVGNNVTILGFFKSNTQDFRIY
jgi:hypothetical protein